jgi:type II secretory pathway pseudopilin PulG
MRNEGRKTTVRHKAGLSGDGGFALPTVMFMSLAAFAIVSVAVFTTIQTQSGTVRDQQSKAALASAEAGISQALMRYNGDFNPTSSAPCLVPDGTRIGATATQGTGWCAPVQGFGAGNFSYQVCPGPPCADEGTIEIVGVGETDGVTRRVDVTANSSSGEQIFTDASVKMGDGILLDSNAVIHAGSSTDGDITLGSNAKQCGHATVGIGHRMTTNGNSAYYGNTDCSGQLSTSSVGQENLILPPVNQGDAATVNDNCRISRAVPVSDSRCTFDTTDPKDLISGNPSKVNWNPNTRQLSIDANTALTLTGRTYSFCKITLSSNAALYLAAGQTVAMYFDSPEACGLPYDVPSNPSLGTTQLSVASNARITSASGTPANVAMLFVGSQSRLTNLLMSSNTQISGSCVQNFVIYAPYTHIEMNSNSQYCGVMAGKSLHMDSNAEVFTNSLSQEFTLPGTAPHYVASQFVECSAEVASPPDAGC